MFQRKRQVIQSQASSVSLQLGGLRHGLAVPDKLIAIADEVIE